MKKIEAIIKPYKLNDVVKALEAIEVYKLVAEEVKGYGRSVSPTALYKTKKGMNFMLEYLPKIKLYLVVEDNIAEQVVECIMKTATNNELGDGKLFVAHVEECIDIRSGERGFCGNPG